MRIHPSKVLFTFISFSICTLTNTCLLDTLCNMGFVEQFVALLQRDHDSTHEHLLAALLALTQSHPPSIEECRRSEFLFREFLDNRIELIGDRDECLVIIISQYLKMRSNSNFEFSFDRRKPSIAALCCR